MQHPGFSKARVGDRVWSIQSGWGEITSISGKRTRPIRVKFRLDYEDYYKNGKTSSIDEYPSLFWTEIPIPPEALTPPKRTRKETRWFFIWYSNLSGFQTSCLYETKATAKYYMYKHNFRSLDGPFAVTFEVEDE